MRWRSAVGAAALVLCAASQAAGHHSFAAEFDATTSLTLQGTIVQVEWVNPHCLLWMDVRAPSGAIERWALELPPPNALVRKGVQRTLLLPGEMITATGYKAKNGRALAMAKTLVVRNGLTIVTLSPGTSAPGVTARDR